MNYIILDLEWNQGSEEEHNEVKDFPFEIIDIGAIKLNSKRNMTSEFNQLIKPQVYLKMHTITSKLIHLHMRDLMKGNPFSEVMREFLDWCGENYIFCTWGPADLLELQRNMAYYGMEPLSNKSIRYLDVQKLFSISYEDRKIRRTLEYAVNYLAIEKDIPFHRAFSDAYYTAKVFAALKDSVLDNYSYDTYILPKNQSEEIHVNFDTYHKYISREFENKQIALMDKEVMSTRCYLCQGHKNLRKKIRWFSLNGKHYLSVSVCPLHGYMKSKIRVKKSVHDKVYIIKTSKFISEQEVKQLSEKKNHDKGSSDKKGEKGNS